MQEEKIKELLETKYKEEVIHPYKRKIIFWYDESASYSEYVDKIPELINNVDIKVFKISRNKKGKLNNIFDIKYNIEHLDKESNYLIYSPEARPHAKDNLLLDIYLYSEEFIADEPSMIIEEFKFDKNYREFINKYIKFFDSKDRKIKLKDLLAENPTEKELELGILAALTNIKVLKFEEVLKALFVKGLEEENKYYKEISKYCFDLFWEYIEEFFGLEFKIKTIRNLFNNMLLIHMYYTIKENPPIVLDKKAKAKAQNVYVFIEHWMNDKKLSKDFMELSYSVEKELKVSSHINNIDFEKLIQINTFKVIDSFILNKISDYILNGDAEFSDYKEWINLRRDISPWNNKIKEIYKTLAYAVELLNISRFFEVKEREVEDIYEGYLKKYYKIDMFYRKFYENYDKIKMLDIEKIDLIRERIEKLYINKLQRELLGYWDKSLDKIKDNWELINYINQKDFYSENISKSKEKVFVIISDALRYEVAKELQEKLLSKIESNKVDLDSMLGTAPSYTRLGMASLLPHNNKIEFSGSTITIDSQDVSSTENREKVLKKENSKSVAFQFENLKKWKRNELRDITKGTEVVYIYHNVIDKIGDDRSSEINVFDACNKAVSELFDTVKQLTASLSATNIIITADHGFIYQRESLENYDKLESKDLKTLVNPNKRYLYTKDSTDKDGTIKINMDYIFKNQEINAIIPKENLRFKCPGGGINYVHGGASLQELVIPVIKYKFLRNKKAEISKVNLEFITLSRMIRNNVSKFKFIQVEAVNELEKILARTVKFGIYDGGNLISNEKQLSLNSKEEGTKIELVLTLKSGNYDKQNDYKFRVLDIESNEILFDENYRIDIGIANEFEF